MNRRVSNDPHALPISQGINRSMRPILIGGCERSGTTLLGSILGASPAAVTIPESRFRYNALIDAARSDRFLSGGDLLHLMTEDSLFKLWPIPPPAAITEPTNFRNAVEEIIRSYAQQHEQAAAEVWIDHTPINVRYALQMAEHFPEAKYLHLIRDGRAVSASILDLDWGPNTIPRAARHWIDRIAQGLALETSSIGCRVMRVHYEDLVSDTERTLRLLCDFCEIEFHPQMLAGGRFAVPPHMKKQNQLVGGVVEVRRAYGSRNRLSAREIEIFESVAGELLQYLGYQPMYQLSARPVTDAETRRYAVIEWYRNKIVNKPRKKRRLALGSA